MPRQSGAFAGEVIRVLTWSIESVLAGRFGLFNRLDFIDSIPCYYRRNSGVCRGFLLERLRFFICRFRRLLYNREYERYGL